MWRTDGQTDVQPIAITCAVWLTHVKKPQLIFWQHYWVANIVDTDRERICSVFTVHISCRYLLFTFRVKVASNAEWFVVCLSLIAVWSCYLLDYYLSTAIHCSAVETVDTTVCLVLLQVYTAIHCSAVLSKKTGNCSFCQKWDDSILWFSMLLSNYVQSKKAVSALQTGINHDTNKPYLQNYHAISARKP